MTVMFPLPLCQSPKQPFLMSSRTAVWAGALSDDTKNGCVADYPYAAIFTDQKSWLKTQKTI